MQESNRQAFNDKPITGIYFKLSYKFKHTDINAIFLDDI